MAFPAQASFQHGSVSAGSSEHLSFGQKAVGLTFNVTSDPNVDAIKCMFASIIDQLHILRLSMGDTNPEVARMLSIAITEAQTAQMWAVKAVTWRYNE